MAELPKIISVDDHVLEPPNVWLDRLPAKYHDVGPRIERKIASNLKFNGTTYTYDLDQPDGVPTDFWVYEDLIMPHRRIIAAAGYPVDEVTLTPITYDDMRPGCYEQKGRLEDMDVNWVEASLSFPTFPRFCGQTFLEAKDHDLALLCVKAYNDWMVEEWSAGTGGRLIPLCLIPLWDPHLAADEVRRNAARGVPAVCFSEIPYHLGLPSIHDGAHWDPFFDACEETDTVVCMHIGSSSKMPATSPDAPASVQATLSFNNAMGSLSDFLYSGVLVRHPRLKLAYSEGQIGWIPYVLERADDVWNQFRGWAFPREQVPEPPSTYYYRQVYGCFFRDHHGITSLDEVGVDNITFETDYPHSDSTWPNTKAVAEELFADLSDEDTSTRSCGATPSRCSTSTSPDHRPPVTRYGVDEARSSITAAVRPPMGPPTIPATVTGQASLELAGDPDADGRPHRLSAGEVAGSIEISLDGQPPVAVDLALAAADAAAELSHGPDDEVVLWGQRSAPAGAFGIVGPPLLNPTIVLSWRLVLNPID